MLVNNDAIAIGGEMTREGRVVGFLLRLPPELHDRLKALAARERRSLQGQILYLLERAMEVEQEGKAAA